jgi:hypothetical protein
MGLSRVLIASFIVWPIALNAAAHESDPQVKSIVIVGSKPAVVPAACIQVHTVSDLDHVRNNLAGHYCLTNDIDLSAVANFIPIGGMFTGVFAGQNFTIRNLNITSTLDSIGLFGGLGGASTVSNLTLEHVTLIANGDSTYVGGLAGNAAGRVTAVHVSGSIDCTGTCTHLGGAIGHNSGSIAKSSASASVVGNTGADVGGLFGDNSGTISQCYATGAVSLAANSDSSFVGGLGGLNGGAISQSFATGPVTAPGDNTVGGDFVGGLVGENSHTITQSFATGAVSAGRFFSAVAGLVGEHDSSTNNPSSIVQSYALGPVTNSSTGPSGGLVGLTHGPSNTAHSAFWDTQTSGQNASALGAGRTSAALQTKLPAGFGAAIWAITPNVSFAYLTAVGLNFRAPLAITLKGICSIRSCRSASLIARNMPALWRTPTPMPPRWRSPTRRSAARSA